MKSYEFQDRWTVQATPAEVWRLISDPSTFSEWWPIYQEARFLEGQGGPGSRILLKFRGVLPYTLTVESTVERTDPPHFFEGRVLGELEGTWSWTLTPTPEGGTQVTFQQKVETRKRILDWLGPVFRLLIAMNHRNSADRGARGMQAYFARRKGAAQGT